jgi:hypothetical protein
MFSRSRVYRVCDVYWGMEYCRRHSGHDGPHLCGHCGQPPDPNALLSGSDAPVHTVPDYARGRSRRKTA